jgi:DNA-binding transcriptional LysR family regulator
MPNVQVLLETGASRKLIEEVRAGHLDAAVVSLPAPTAGLHRTLLGDQSAVLAVPVMHSHATDEAIDLGLLAPERIVMMPREVNPAFYDGVLSVCRDAAISPAIAHTVEPRVELALLAVSAGAGVAILPESVAHSVSVPGIRFVPVEADQPIAVSAVLTRTDADDIATQAFTHALVRASKRQRPMPVPVAEPDLHVAVLA